jgi:23S rRNA pseudouridine1911/1915/1917 synthase
MQDTQAEEGETLLDALRRIHPESSTGTLRRMLTQGRVQVDGDSVHAAKTVLSAGQRVEVVARIVAEEQHPAPQKRPKGPKLDVVFEDEAILVVNKPAGLLSVATNKLEDDTLHSRCVAHVRAHHGERAWVHVVHRLDRETSGVMVFARHARHKDDLQRQFADRDVHRIYRALTEGCPEAPQGTVVAHLVEDDHLNVREMKPGYRGAREAITHYRVLDEDGLVADVELLIETGRRHQIRMAMRKLGCPIVGDHLHGATADPLGRVALHAHALEFLHPESEEPVRFEAPVPFVT